MSALRTLETGSAHREARFERNFQAQDASFFDARMFELRMALLAGQHPAEHFYTYFAQ